MTRSLKQQRVCSYFVQSAKEMILLEGVERVSVRKVAECTGYTFSTIYKYFRHLEALLREVKAVMIQALFTDMQNAIPAKLLELDDIKKAEPLLCGVLFRTAACFSILLFLPIAT